MVISRITAKGPDNYELILTFYNKTANSIKIVLDELDDEMRNNYQINENFTGIVYLLLNFLINNLVLDRKYFNERN